MTPMASCQTLSPIYANYKDGLASVEEEDLSFTTKNEVELRYVRKNDDAPIIEDWVSDNKDEVESPVVVEKKTVVPTIPKVDVVRLKQQEKPVRKTVRYTKMYSSKGPRGNQSNWNNQKSQQLGSNFMMYNKACYVCESFNYLQYTCKQKRQLNGQREKKPVWNNARRVNHQNSPRHYFTLSKKAHGSKEKSLNWSAHISLNTARQVNLMMSRPIGLMQLRLNMLVWSPLKRIIVQQYLKVI
ncbi:hypothetical protein Tco_0634502 [Tanacetum coccineum]